MTTSASAAPVTATPVRERAVWVDRLRAGLVVLVILHHAAITYGASGSWFFKATHETSVPLTFLAAVNQSFFMGLFFMISGALAVGSLARKGPAAFVADRAIRLGVPVLVFGFVLGPATVALATASLASIPGDAAARIFGGSFVLGPLWFPAALLAFSMVLAALPTGPASTARPVPPFSRWLALALGTGVAALFVRQAVPVGATVAGFQLGYFASYIVLFAVGVLAGRNGWLERLPGSSVRAAVAVGCLALPVLPVALLATEAPRFETGFSAAAVTYALWEPLVALGAIAALIRWSWGRGERGAVFWSQAAAASYGAFILHAPILVAVSRTLDAFGTPHAIALPVAVVATTLAAFALAGALRASSFVRRVV